MYSNNNTAKEYVLRNIAKRLDGNKNASILDFACGTCLIWKNFLNTYNQANFNGFDFNAESIRIAKENFPNFKKNIIALDGQKKLPFDDQFDIITTFSSLEHVVNKYAFLKNIKHLLKSDGVAYLNYDSGHFRSGLQTTIYNYLSQLLTKLGITEKYFTKKVCLLEIKNILNKLNLEIISIKYFNLPELKKIYKTINLPNLLEDWYEYELSINQHTNKQFLEEKFLSVVIEVKNRE
jgi:ubiquinone/menaquinone biosynthesis C-methylase UbiE